jgi:hypothetical protein
VHDVPAATVDPSLSCVQDGRGCDCRLAERNHAGRSEFAWNESDADHAGSAAGCTVIFWKEIP